MVDGQGSIKTGRESIVKVNSQELEVKIRENQGYWAACAGELAKEREAPDRRMEQRKIRKKLPGFNS
jgi:hypothetical protein